MQPVQDLTVEDRVSRTQYPVQPRGRRREGARRPGRRASSSSCKALPELRDVASDQQNAGAAGAPGHRPRHGVAPRHHAADDRRRALRRVRPAADLDDVHAAEPVPRRARGRARASSSSPDDLTHIYVRSAAGGAVPLCGRSRASRRTNAPLAVNHQGQFPVVTVSFNLAPGASLGEAVRAIERRQRRARAAARASRPSFQGTAAGVPGSLANAAVPDPGGARHGLHRARRALRELHPPDHDPLDAAVGRRGRAARADDLPHGVLA